MKIFVSYSLRQDYVTKSHLDSLRNIRRHYPDISMYIDLFDNPNGYNGGEKSLWCPAHRHVLHEISKSDVFLLLSDPSVSPWVCDELKLAQKLNIAIQKTTAYDLGTLLDDYSARRFMATNNLVKGNNLVA